jgi:HEAT repeat protein
VTLRAAAPAALLLLLQCAPADDAQSLFRDLQSNDSDARQEAAERLEQLVGRNDYRTFVRGAESGPPAVRVESLLYLARLTAPEARAALRGFLRVDHLEMLPYNPIRFKPSTEQSDSRILVANLIQQNGGDPEAVGTLVAGMEGRPAAVLAGTCLALGALRDPKGIPFLAEMVRRPEIEIVRAAVQALGHVKGLGGLEALKVVANHPSMEVRADLISSLEFLDDPGIRDLYMTIASTDPSPEIRGVAIDQLGRYRQAPVVDYLIGRLRARDDATRTAALQTLTQMTGQNLGPGPEKWSRWWSQNRQRFAAATR